jgi:hypothetical protein
MARSRDFQTAEIPDFVEDQQEHRGISRHSTIKYLSIRQMLVLLKNRSYLVDASIGTIVNSGTNNGGRKLQSVFRLSGKSAFIKSSQCGSHPKSTTTPTRVRE